MSRLKLGMVASMAAVTVITMATPSMGAVTVASAAVPFNPNQPVINDPLGVTQDWFIVNNDGQAYGYFWDEAGTNQIPPGVQVSVDSGVTVTVYARHYDGMVQPIQLPFTNKPGGSYPNTVSFTDRVCNPATGFTTLQASWNQTPDGSGLVSYRPGMYVVDEQGVGFFYKTLPNVVVGDGQSFNLNQAISYPTVEYAPGWYTVEPHEFHRPDGTGGLLIGATSRLWVEPCGTSMPPDGQVSPSGVVYPLGSGSTQGGSQSATGSLKQIRRTTKMRVIMANKSKARVTFMVVVNPKKGKTTVGSYSVPKSETRRPVIRAPRGTKFVLKVRIKQPSGWATVVLDRAKLR